MADKPTVLVVDDESDIRELLTITLAKMNISCIAVETLSQARSLLKTQHFFLCLVDLRLPDGNGLELVSFIQQQYPELPAAIITAYGNVEGAVEALKAGAFDYISKPVNLQILRDLVNAALQMIRTSKRTKGIERKLLGSSKIMQHLRAKIGKLARSQSPIYISGASGVGKELVARMIHTYGPRANKPFIAVNCGAIPTELMESEFFGHKRGSFTGAVADKKGLFQAANGGILLLDEVADLPLHMQVKLLRAIQEKAVRPIGEQYEIPVDVRILSASHKDLHQLVMTGEFRQDLFYRINVIELTVPSLKERIEDLPELTDAILQKLAKQQKVKLPVLSAAALITLRSYSFPGNVRELENILERAMTLCENYRIESEDLQLLTVEAPHTEANNHADLPLTTYLDEKEKQLILQVLQKTKWNRTLAAKKLGISLRALRYRLSKLGIDKADVS